VNAGERPRDVAHWVCPRCEATRTQFRDSHAQWPPPPPRCAVGHREVEMEQAPLDQGQARRLRGLRALVESDGRDRSARRELGVRWDATIQVDEDEGGQ
jgi:hypothetical protein